tara:strand:- start:46 stop:702 length:657 start_codon:yes stop_codon:yes gene_type:complete
MENKPLAKNNLLQDLAIEYFALSPSITVKEVSDKLDIPVRTLVRWRSNPDFGEAVYKRAMVEYALELPAVLHSTITEAQNGNVQAQRLVLEQFGKLTKNNVNIIISPFEQFIQNNNDKGSKEINFEEMPIVEPQDVEIESKVEVKDEKEERNRNFQDLQRQEAKRKRNLKQKEWYRWRKRAKSVGVEPLKNKRPTPLQRKEWENKIIAAEKLRDTEKE